MVLSKVAAVGAHGVALFPCGCSGHAETVPHVHFASAAVMFLILAYFCYVFYKRARGKGHPEANRRAFVYAASGLAIIASILSLVLDTLSGGVLTAAIPRLVFYCERAGWWHSEYLGSQPVAYSQFLTRSDERFSLLGTASDQ